jgi:hypothetical protein
VVLRYGGYIRGKVFTLLTLFITNNLSVYKTVYTFKKVFTSLEINDLSVYITLKENCQGFFVS